MRWGTGLCLAFTLALLTPSAEADPSRVAIVRPPHPDALLREATTRLGAELTASGFEVIAVDTRPGLDPRAEVEGAAVDANPIAAVAIVRADGAHAADVWIANHSSDKTQVSRVDLGAAPAKASPATLAIHAAELFRANMLAVAATPPAPSPAVAAPVPPSAPATAERQPSAPEPPTRSTALLEGVGIELGIAALYGFGDMGGRLAPTLRVSYGGSRGISGRLNFVGPTATDQVGLLELCYSLDPWRQEIVPTVSLSAGGAHAHIEDQGQMPHRLVTNAWAFALGGGAGLAARPNPHASLLFDAHALYLKPGRDAVVGRSMANGRASLLVVASLGVTFTF